MKNIIIFFSLAIALAATATNETNTIIKKTRMRKMINDTKTSVSTNATPRKLKKERDDQKHDNVKIYIAKEGWQTNIGFREMQKYLKTLAEICNNRIPNLIRGIAAGKNGIMMQISFKAQKKFYGARENTEEFLTSIVGDLEKMPEPITPEVRMTCNGKEIIKAFRSGDKIKVKFLL